MLKFKAAIYRYLGIYLAHKEANEYLTSKEFWKKFLEIVAKDDESLGTRNIQGILLGSWQADHGFTRPWSNLIMKQPYWLWKPILWLDTSFKAVLWDIQALLKRIL